MASNYGYLAKIGIDTSGMQAGLKSLNTSLAATDREIRATNKAIKAASDAGVDSTELYRQKQDELTSAIGETQEKLNALKSVQDKMYQAMQNGDISAEQYRDYQREISNTEARLRNYEAELRNTQEAERNTANQSKELTEKMNAVKSSVAQVAEDLKEIAAAVAAVGTAVGAAAVGIGKYAVEVGSSFDSAMSSVQAYSQASGEELQKLREAAKEAGANTSKSATESAQALSYMSLAGWDTAEMLNGLMPILRASEAGNADLASTSDLVTDSMSAMGVSVGDLTRYLDICTAAQSNSNTSLTGLLEAYVGCGGSLKNLNVPLEESAAWLGVLANRGIKASEAGTSFNSILVNLVGANSSAAAAMDTLGVSAWDQQGNFIGLTETLQLLSDALSTCTDEEKALFEAKIGGKTQMDTLQALIGGLNEEFYELEDTLKNSQGALDATAQTMQDNLIGSVTVMKSAMEGVGVEIFEYLDEPLRGAVNRVTEIFNSLNVEIKSGELKPMLEEISVKIGELIEKFAEFAADKGIPTLIDGIGALVDGLSWFVDNLDTIIALAEGVGAAFLTWKLGKIAVDVIALVGAVQALSAAAAAGSTAAAGLASALTAIPGVAAIAAIAGITVALIELQLNAMKSVEDLMALDEGIQNSANGIIEANRNLIQSNNDVKKSIEKANVETEKQIKTADRAMAQIGGLVDENGNLKDASADVSKELSILNDTFGTQLEVIDGQIRGWKDLKESYEGYVLSLRQNAKLEAMHEGYVNAVSESEALKSQRSADIAAYKEATSAYRQYMHDYEGTTAYDAGYAEKLRIDAEQAKANLNLTIANIELNKKTIDDYEKLSYELTEKSKNTGSDDDAEDSPDTSENSLEAEFQAEIDALDDKKALHKEGLNEDKNYYSEKQKILNKYFDGLSGTSKSFWKEYDSVSDYYANQGNTGETSGVLRKSTSAGTGAKKTDTEEKERLKLLEENAKKELDLLIEKYENGKIIRESFNAEYAELEKKWASDNIDIEEYAAKQVKSAREKVAKEEINTLSEIYAEGEISREEFNRRYADLVKEWGEDNVEIEKYAADKVKTAREKAAKEDLDILIGMLNDGIISREEFNAADLKLQQENAEDGISIAKYRAGKIADINKKELEDWQKNSEKIVDEISESYEELEQERQKATEGIASGSLTETVTDKNGRERTVFSDLNKRTEQIREYISDLKKLKKTDIPQDLLAEIYNMDFDSRRAAVKELLNMSAESMKLYYSDYNSWNAAAREAADLQTEEKATAIAESAKKKVGEILTATPESAYENGGAAARTYLQGVYDELEKAGVGIDITSMLFGRNLLSRPASGTYTFAGNDGISGNTQITINLDGKELLSETFDKLLEKKGLSGRNVNRL